MANEPNFYIVAIGVSAGGQEPLWRFFAEIPPDSGRAFVVIQHLNRDYISMADKLLAMHTLMPVCWATNQQQVMPNTISLLPINKTMTIENGYRQLQTRPIDDKSNWAVDIFFKSLAKGKKPRPLALSCQALAQTVP